MLTDVFTADTSSLFIIILAVVGISGEWRHRTITSSLLAAPDRLRFLAAKTLAFAVVGLLLSLAISLACRRSGYTILIGAEPAPPGPGSSRHRSGTTPAWRCSSARSACASGLWCATRWWRWWVSCCRVFVLEPAVLGLAPDVWRYGPFVGLPAAVQDLPSSDLGDDVELLSPPLAVLAMLVWIGAAFATGGALLRRRDVE